MQSTRHGLRITLLASVSVVALVAAAPNAGAADMASPPVYKKALPPLPPQSTWSWWIEGGAFNTGGDSVGFPAFKTNWGGEGAIGFDWQAQPLWHVLGQFRYGTASKSPSNQFSFISGPSTVNVSENQNLREDHWLVDFGVGRDFGLGNNVMWTLGVRVADLRSKLNGNFNIATVGLAASPTTIAIQEKSTFVGAGPRLGVQGDTPLGGQWSVDWQAGAAALIGERTLDNNGQYGRDSVCRLPDRHSRNLQCGCTLVLLAQYQLEIHRGLSFRRLFQGAQNGDCH